MAGLAVAGAVAIVLVFKLASPPAAPRASESPAAPAPVPSATAEQAVAAPSSSAKAAQEGEVTFALRERGITEGAFDRPRHVAIDAQGSLFVADNTGRVQRFDSEGAFVSAFRAETTNRPHGPLSNDIARVEGLAVDRRGRIIVTIGYDLVLYDAGGKQLSKVAHKYPDSCFRTVTVDQDANWWVRSGCTDSDRYAILRMDDKGKVLERWEESPAWQTDSTDKIAVDGDGNLYVPHGHQNLVYVLDGHGKQQSTFGGKGNEPGYFFGIAPGAIAIDRAGRLFMASGWNVDMYDRHGHVLARLPRQTGPVVDLAVRADGQLWVADTNGVVRIRPPSALRN